MNLPEISPEEQLRVAIAASEARERELVKELQALAIAALFKFERKAPWRAMLDAEQCDAGATLFKALARVKRELAELRATELAP